MKTVIQVLVCITVVMVSTASHAAVQPGRLEAYDTGCVYDFSTAGCFGYSTPSATKFEGPKVTACAAIGSQNQRCRFCAEALWNDGSSRGYQVCGYTASDAYCSCEKDQTPNCSGLGNCTYQ